MTDKITINRSVLEQALKALERADRIAGYKNNWAETVALRAALRQPQSPFGDCDECGTPYSYDPTDGGCICVRCMKEKLATTQPQVDQETKSYRITGKTGEFCVFHSTEVKRGDMVYTNPQPPRQPLTMEEITAMSRIAADDPDDWPEPWAFHMGVVAAERHHGIRSDE